MSFWTRNTCLISPPVDDKSPAILLKLGTSVGTLLRAPLSRLLVIGKLFGKTTWHTTRHTAWGCN